MSEHAYMESTTDEVDVTKRGLTGETLYREFLPIAAAAGGYREGANECQTFANSMLEDLTAAIEKKQEKKEEKKQTADTGDEENYPF
jgi:hypothetical protein